MNHIGISSHLRFPAYRELSGKSMGPGIGEQVHTGAPELLEVLANSFLGTGEETYGGI